METPAEPESGKTPAKKPSAGQSKRPTPGKKPVTGRGPAAKATTTSRSGAAAKPGGSRSGQSRASRTQEKPVVSATDDETANASVGDSSDTSAPAADAPEAAVAVEAAAEETTSEDDESDGDQVSAEATDGASAAEHVEPDGESAESHVEAEPEVEDEAEPEVVAPRAAFTAPKLTIPTLSAGSSAIARLGRAMGARLRPDQDAPEEPSDATLPSDESLPSDEPTADIAPVTEGDDTAAEPAPRAERAPVDESPEEPVTDRPEPEPEPAPTAGTDVLDRVPAPAAGAADVLSLRGLTKRFDDTVAVDSITLTVPAGTIYGIVGPNGAGKTTTLSMITGLLRPDEGTVTVHGADVWADPVVAKRQMGVLPDRLRLFDRLTGSQLLYYSAVLRGLDAGVARTRVADLGAVFRIEDALGRLVSDYSSGMTKKVALAAAMIHAPRLLVLDEPFESVDPVSAATVTDILRDYTAAGGTVLLSSHSMALVERVCDRVAVIVDGELLADGTVDEVRGDGSLEERFVQLAGGTAEREGVEWLHTFSD